jgi:hypothetical protein
MHTTVTLWDSLFEDAAHRPDALARGESEPAIELGRAVAARGCGGGLPDAAALIAAKLKELLSIGIAEDVFVKSWNDSGVFRRYLDREVYPADRTIDVPMIQHTVTCVHRPSIEIRRDGALLERIRVDVAVTLCLAYAVVEIRGGRIRRLRHGQCRGSAEVKVDGKVVATGRMRDIALPAVMDFGKGIPIAPRVSCPQPLSRSTRVCRRRLAASTRGWSSESAFSQSRTNSASAERAFATSPRAS